METFYILCGPLVVLVIIIALGLKLIHVSRSLPPPPPPSKLGVCSPSDSPYTPTFLQQGSYRQPLHAQPPPPQRLATQCPETLSRYSTVQAPSSSPPSSFQSHRLSSIQYPPLASPPLLSRDALVPEPVCYPPQQPSRPPARAPQVSVVPAAIEPQKTPSVSPGVAPVTEPGRDSVPQQSHYFSRLELATGTPETPSRYSTVQAPSSSQPSPYQPHHLPSIQYPPPATPPLLSRDAFVPKPVCYTPQQPSPSPARAPQVPVVPVTIEHPIPVAIEHPVASALQVPVVPVVIDPRGYPAARAPEVPVARVVIDPYEDPKSLRLKAQEEGDRMGKCFNERNEAKARNDQQRVKELTQRGEAHRENMMLLNKEASAKIFQENNQNRRNEVDLHRLYVSEAKSYFDIAVQEARDREESSLRVIVGKGNHSDNNTPKIKPAIQAHGESLGLSIAVDPRNDGCLIVSFK